MSQAKRDFYARLEPLRAALLEESGGGGASMTDGELWVQVRGFGTVVPAGEAETKARELLETFGRDVASIHPMTCRVAAKPGTAAGAGTCNCADLRWVRLGAPS